MFKYLLLLLPAFMSFRDVESSEQTKVKPIIVKDVERSYLEMMYLKAYKKQFIGDKILSIKTPKVCENWGLKKTIKEGKILWDMYYLMTTGKNTVCTNLNKRIYESKKEFESLYPDINPSLFVSYKDFHYEHNDIMSEFENGRGGGPNSLIQWFVAAFLEDLPSKYRLQFGQDVLIMPSPVQGDDTKTYEFYLILIPAENGYFFLEYVGANVVTYQSGDVGARIVAFADPKTRKIFQIKKGTTTNSKFSKAKISCRHGSSVEENTKYKEQVTKLISSMEGILENPQSIVTFLENKSQNASRTSYRYPLERERIVAPALSLNSEPRAYQKGEFSMTGNKQLFSKHQYEVLKESQKPNLQIQPLPKAQKSNSDIQKDRARNSSHTHKPKIEGNFSKQKEPSHTDSKNSKQKDKNQNSSKNPKLGSSLLKDSKKPKS